MHRGTTKAPPLSEERLSHALGHPNAAIRSLAQIVDEAKKTKTIPNKQDIPSMTMVLDIERALGGLSGEDHESAFHTVWYIKELLLGRHPEL
jgi:hypothetical protein